MNYVISSQYLLQKIAFNSPPSLCIFLNCHKLQESQTLYIIQGMNRKFAWEQYEICISFKTDTLLTVSAEFLPTQQMFLKEAVELVRITKDTVFAALQRKSQKNLKCEMEQIMKEGHTVLQLTFVVNFEYLPQFKETIELELVDRRQSIQNISAYNFQVELEETERVLNKFNDFTPYWDVPAISAINVQREMWTHQVTKGTYLIKVSGVYNNSNGGNNIGETITFKLGLVGGEKQIRISCFNQYGYSYPFYFSELVNAEEGELRLTVTGPSSNSNITSCNLLLNHVFQI